MEYVHKFLFYNPIQSLRKLKNTNWQRIFQISSNFKKHAPEENRSCVLIESLVPLISSLKTFLCLTFFDLYARRAKVDQITMCLIFKIALTHNKVLCYNDMLNSNLRAFTKENQRRKFKYSFNLEHSQSKLKSRIRKYVQQKVQYPSSLIIRRFHKISKQ